MATSWQELSDEEFTLALSPNGQAVANRIHRSMGYTDDHNSYLSCPCYHQAVDELLNAERIRTYDGQTGEPHDDVLVTKAGKILTEADIQRFAEEDADHE